MSGRVEDLARTLEARGIEVGELHDLQEELDLIEKPPGLFRRLTLRMQRLAHTQWGHVVGEIQESRELMGLLSRGLSPSGEPLSPEERDTIKAQLFDLLRVVPAGLIAAANAALPMPGTSVFTPWLLVRLGLMPSRWREAHLLGRLEAEAARLRAGGHEEEALLVEALEQDLEEEADARVRAAHEAALLTRWDDNSNGRWDDEEVRAYEATHAHLVARAAAAANQRRWFLSHGDQVFGPMRLSEIQGAPPDTPLLICFDAATGWVSLDDLLSGTIPPERFQASPP